MSYRYRVRFECPYCGAPNLRDVMTDDPPRIVNCCPDDGGCDREFVADAVVRIVPRTRRIEGETLRGAS